MRLKIILLLLIGTFASCKGQTNNSIKFGNFNLDSLVNKELQKKNIPSLAIGIVFDGKVVFSKAYGLANVEDGIPATEFTVYQIGSVTKVFTGHLLAQLIIEKRLSLSDPLADFFPSNLGFPKSSTGQLVHGILNAYDYWLIFRKAFKCPFISFSKMVICEQNIIIQFGLKFGD